MTGTIKRLPKSERPRERLSVYGTKGLSNQELLAVLMTSGNGGRHDVVQIAGTLLDTFRGNLIDMFSASIEELSKVEGIGFAKACQIKACFELGKRTASYFEEEHPVISSTDDVVKLVSPHMMYLKQEEFRVILLDSKSRLIRCHTISRGSLDAALVHPRDVFRHALAACSQSIILVHNHPSGDPTPSEKDILLTRQLLMCSQVMDIEILDHVIIGFPGYVSLKHRQLM